MGHVTETFPADFPVFPLSGALLLPKGKLPLNIFEPRYLAMVEDALGAGRVFGMIQPDRTARSTDNGPGLSRVGCLGRLSTFSETDDGRFLITLTGVIRFSVSEELAMRRGYRRVAAAYEGYYADLEEADNVPLRRQELLAALRRYFETRGFDANWDAINAMPDETLVTTLAMVCPFQPSEKQALLEAATQADRANTLLALLKMGVYGNDDEPGRTS